MLSGRRQIAVVTTVTVLCLLVAVLVVARSIRRGQPSPDQTAQMVRCLHAKGFIVDVAHDSGVRLTSSDPDAQLLFGSTVQAREPADILRVYDKDIDLAGDVRVTESGDVQISVVSAAGKAAGRHLRACAPP
ncbi:MAG TPA: hypothetical protein VGQ45_08790 [Gaiellales bacterium]|jgi:hypothetical protein|nr:hypothetical protein [Gaiellales bacterium]